MTTTIHPRTERAQQSVSIWQSVRSLLACSLDTLCLWQQRHRGRRDLLHLNERMLRDIGLNRVEAAREADKPFWRP